MGVRGGGRGRGVGQWGVRGVDGVGEWCNGGVRGGVDGVGLGVAGNGLVSSGSVGSRSVLFIFFF